MLGDFAMAGSPGQGSRAGAFVRLRNGGYVPRSHPLAVQELGPDTGLPMEAQPQVPMEEIPAMATPEGPYGGPKPPEAYAGPAMTTPGGPIAGKDFAAPFEQPEAVPGFADLAQKPGMLPAPNPDAMLSAMPSPALTGANRYGGANTGIAGGMDMSAAQPQWQAPAASQANTLGNMMAPQPQASMWGKPQTAATNAARGSLGSMMGGGGNLGGAAKNAFRFWGS